MLSHEGAACCAPALRCVNARRLSFAAASAINVGFILQAFRDDHDAFIGLFPFFLFDGFAHKGHRFCRVAGVEAGRVELVA